eukprot:Amastigsp_a509716_29.p4 type:complete len:160 gc:universal Amastigsp_a509716_29:1605-1126(-)
MRGAAARALGRTRPRAPPGVGVCWIASVVGPRRKRLPPQSVAWRRRACASQPRTAMVESVPRTTPAIASASAGALSHASTEPPPMRSKQTAGITNVVIIAAEAPVRPKMPTTDGQTTASVVESTRMAAVSSALRRRVDSRLSGKSRRSMAARVGNDDMG